MRLEQIYTKDEILERYLNTVYFGRDAYGIRAASERYFHEAPINLTIPQAATLAGMISAPSAYDPVLHPAASRARRHQVLVAMRETGVVNDAAVKAFDKYPMPIRTYNIASIAPNSYFVSEVVQRLLADPRLGPDVPTRRNLIYHGGLRITTTFDPVLQRAAESAVKTQIAAASRTPSAPIPVTGALVAIGACDGERQRRRERRRVPQAAVQLRDGPQPPGGLGVQGLHPRDRARERLLAARHDRRFLRMRDPTRPDHRQQALRARR
jgi:membrane peptidoglycan carboxypeptidase